MKTSIWLTSIAAACLSFATCVIAAEPSGTVNDPAVNSSAPTSPSMNGGPTVPQAPGSQIMEPKKTGTRLGSEGELGPCVPIKDACIAAGFSDNSANGMDVENDCLNPILSGVSINNVNVKSDIIDACNHIRNHQQQPVGNAMQGTQPATSSVPSKPDLN